MDTQTTQQFLTPLLEWQAPTRVEQERSGRWYLIAGIGAATVIAYGLFTGAWSLSITVGMLAGLYFLVRNQKHPDHTVRILPLGIEFDGRLRPWDEWKNFWLLTGKDFIELHVSTAKPLQRDLIILTGTMNPVEIAEVLSQFIEQHPNPREKLLDAFIRFCKL